jgi:hypothetical protein
MQDLTRREVRHIAYSRIGSEVQPAAVILTYGTRKRGLTTWHYKTVVLGRWFRDRREFQTWIKDWDSEADAIVGHPKICEEIATFGPNATVQ